MKQTVVTFLLTILVLTSSPILAQTVACPVLDLDNPAWVITLWKTEYSGKYIKRGFSYEPDLLQRRTKAKDSPCSVIFYSQGIGKNESMIWQLRLSPEGKIYSLKLADDTWVNGQSLLEVAEYSNQGRRLRFSVVENDGKISRERVTPIPEPMGLRVIIDD